MSVTNPIDKKFKNALRNHEVTPNTSVWKRLGESIPFVIANQHWYNNRLKLATVALLLSLSSFTIGYYYQRVLGDELTSITNEQPANQLQNLDIATVDNAIAELPTGDLKHEWSNHSDLPSGANPKQNFEPTENSSASIVPSIAVLSSENKHDNKANNSVNEPTQLVNASSSIANGISVVDAADNSFATLESILAFTPTLSAKNAQLSIDQNLMAIEPTKHKSTSIRLSSIVLATSFTQAYRNNNFGSGELVTPKLGFSNASKNFGVNLGFTLTKRLTLLSGVHFFQNQFRFNQSFDVKMEPDTIKYPGIAPPIDPKELEKLRKQNGLSGDTHFDINYDANFQYVEIPMLLQMHFGKRNLRFFVAGGPTFSALYDFSYSSTTSTNNQSVDNKTTDDLASKLNPNRLLFGSCLMTGIEYQPSTRISFFASPTARMYLTDMVRNGHNPSYNYGLSTGVIVHL